MMPIALLLSLAVAGLAGASSSPDMEGRPVNIALSAYQYRADRKPAANPPESWLALMHFAGLPLNKPVDLNNAAVKRALYALLWEEIRPVKTLELTWPASAKHVPAPERLTITALVAASPSSSWWNNLRAESLKIAPALSNGGRTYTYEIRQPTCGLVVSADAPAAGLDVPEVRALVSEKWKRQEVEIEWGFDAATAGKDFGGRVEAYDGRISDLQPLSPHGGAVTGADSWQSPGGDAERRGVKFTLLYMGTTKWRRPLPFTTQPDDVARTIVTVWTKSGSFSFNAADLEHGPILAPEYGFFVRRAGQPVPPPLLLGEAGEFAQRRGPDPGGVGATPEPLTAKMDSIAGSAQLKGWGSNDTPWFGSNATDDSIDPQGIRMPPHSVAMHPGQSLDVVAEWRSPVAGVVTASGTLTHAQHGGNGIEWWIGLDTRSGRRILAHGTTEGSGSHPIPAAGGITVGPGDRICLIVGPKGDHHCDTTILDWTIEDSGGRSWNLARDVAADPRESNPHPDSFGNSGVWAFCSEEPMFSPSVSNPPIRLSSDAASAKEFLAELASRKLSTIREQTRLHPEQTWEGAVADLAPSPTGKGGWRPDSLPTQPEPPAGSEPKMQVSVPDERLTAQWNLGAWHLLRHCGVNPKTGKLWFNDYPYGILAAETYLILSALDQMGMHEEAAAGFDQWLSLPLDRNHPVGLFSEGRGALTYAEGPEGAGGHMDGIHAFGAGSIGWALAQHFWLTGDKEWLKASAPRMIANADWMLRQRRVISGAVPGGERMWCKGLQPALQVTPDSGGLWMQFYEAEGYYWASIARLAEAVAVVDPAEGARLRTGAEAYRRDLKRAVERSIALSPVVPVRDGTYRSVIPFACYVRGLGTGAWGWRRDGSGSHVGPLYWETVQTAAALVSPAGLLPPGDPRVQGWLDVLEDRLLLENINVGHHDWFAAGWQYQAGLERTANMHLMADDIPVFIRSFLNLYAVDILPHDGYVFNEHAVHGPPDKIFGEAAFLERLRDLLVMEDGPDLWIARAAPRDWFADGKRISVRHAPTRFGELSYEIASHGDRITASITLPDREAPRTIHLRLRAQGSRRMKSVQVNGKPWKGFSAAAETIDLRGLKGEANVEVTYEDR